VQIEIGPTEITARITRHAVDRMDLEPGRQVYAMLKSVSIGWRRLGYTMEPSDI
jgi:molybdopterin-binding protein